MEVLRREFIYIWYYFTVQLEQIFGWWVLGMVIGSAVSVFAKDYIHRAFRLLQGKKLGVLGIVAASALGIASPLCMYGTIPIAASFSRGGMKDSWLAAFMMSSILLNPQLIIYSAALGGTVLAVRIVSCFLCGIAAGLLLLFLYRGKPFFNFSGFDGPKKPGYRSQSFGALSEKPLEEREGNRALFSYWRAAFRSLSAVCPCRSHDGSVRRKRSAGCLDGGDHWRPHSTPAAVEPSPCCSNGCGTV